MKNTTKTDPMDLVGTKKYQKEKAKIQKQIAKLDEFTFMKIVDAINGSKLIAKDKVNFLTDVYCEFCDKYMWDYVKAYIYDKYSDEIYAEDGQYLEYMYDEIYPKVHNAIAHKVIVSYAENIEKYLTKKSDLDYEVDLRDTTKLLYMAARDHIERVNNFELASECTKKYRASEDEKMKSTFEEFTAIAREERELAERKREMEEKLEEYEGSDDENPIEM